MNKVICDFCNCEIEQEKLRIALYGRKPFYYQPLDLCENCAKELTQYIGKKLLFADITEQQINAIRARM